MNRRKVYIAGIEDLEKDSVAKWISISIICQEAGFDCLHFNNENIASIEEKNKIAKMMYKNNLRLIDEADIVICNLNLFRGKEISSNVAFDIGYAIAKEKIVYGYIDKKIEYIENFKHYELLNSNGFKADRKGLVVEDFGYPVALMVGCSVSNVIEGELKDVLKKIKN